MNEDARTVWCGNLSEKVTEEILYELFLQGGPVQKVSIPKHQDGKPRTFGFVTYKHIDSVFYAMELFKGTILYNRALSIEARDNVALAAAESPRVQPINQLLQFGQQMLLDYNASNMRIHMLGMNMLPNLTPYTNQVDVCTSKDDRRSRRMHPYHRKESRSNNDHHRDHRDHRDYRARSNHSNHNNRRPNDYSRQDYKNNRRNYH